MPEGFDLTDYETPIFKVSILSEEDEEPAEGMFLKSSHLDLAHKANGKLGLYLHAYFTFTFFSFYAKQVAETDFDSLLAGSSELSRLQGLHNTMISFSQRISKYPFSHQQYEKMVNEFGTIKGPRQNSKLLVEIQKSLFVSQIANDTQSLERIERLLIQLLGHKETPIRD